MREQLVSKLKDRSIPARLDGESVILESMGCSLGVSEVEGDSHRMMKPFRVLAQVDGFANPIEDQLVGLGESESAQADNAADLWLDTFVDPLYDFLHGPQGDPPLSMATTAPTGEFLAWQVFCRAPAGTAADQSPGRMELFEHLVGPVNPLLFDRSPHSLKCFLSKSEGPCANPGDNLNASCHFDNQDWMEGMSALLYLGDRWGQLDHLRMRRQWFFFKPVQPETLGDAWDKITAGMSPPRKPWWKFW